MADSKASGASASPAFSHPVNDTAGRILANLQAVEREHQDRAALPALLARTQAVKAFQLSRLEDTYADLLADDRHGKAAQFFIQELNGLRDGAERAGQIARIVPTLVSAFPRELVDTVAAFSDLHALSESLDTTVARKLRSDEITPARYATAWRAAGRHAERQRQVDLTVTLGRRLEKHTRDPVLNFSLRMMRGPAMMTGLGGMQRFLETGFDAFASMRGADHFLAAIAEREAALHATWSARAPSRPSVARKRPRGA